MADAHDVVTGPHGGEAHIGPTFNTYLAVFGALAVFTLLSFLVNLVFGQHNVAGAGIILVVAVCKAVLVAMFFMHLKFDWPKLYFIVVPLLILTVMMVIVLLPDAVVNPHVFPADQLTSPTLAAPAEQ
jgi:cytochrome c oxidase subunit 4